MVLEKALYHSVAQAPCRTRLSPSPVSNLSPGQGAAPPGLTKPSLFAIRVPHTAEGLGGVYYRWYGDYFRRLPDRLSAGPSDVGAVSKSSRLQGQETERSDALGAPMGSYSKLGSLLLAEGSRPAECGYCRGARPPMALRYQYRYGGSLALFSDANGAARGTMSFEHLACYEASASEGWLAVSLHEYWREAGETKRAAAGKCLLTRNEVGPAAQELVAIIGPRGFLLLALALGS